MIITCRSGEEGGEDVEGADFADGGVVEAVVAYYQVEQAAALVAVESEEVHIGECHARERHQCFRLFRAEEVAVRRYAGGEHAVEHVEAAAFDVSRRVGLDAEEYAKVVEEADVEIGDAFFQTVEQLHAARYVGEKRGVRLLLDDDVREQLGDEQ